MSGNVNINRIAKNTVMLYIRMLLIMVISLYTARIILKILGAEDFGVYNVVAGVVAMFGFFNSAMTMATQRFLNVEMGKNTGNLNRTFTMAVNIHSIVALIVLFLSETIGIYLVNYVLNIPENRINAANWIFQFAILCACITIVQVPYNSLIYAREQMNVYALVSIGEATLKLLLIFLLSYIDFDKLILYGILTFLLQTIVFFIYFIYANRHFEESKFSLSWDKTLFYKMAGFMGWNILGQTAQILSLQGINIVVNIFYGVILNAAMAVTNQVNTALTSFVNNFQTSFRPQIMKSYAANEIQEMNSLVAKASKISFFLLYAISVPLMFNIDWILEIWLTEVPAYSGIFCKLLIWYSYLEAIGLPLVMSIMATGHNRDYQIVISILIFFNLLLAWLILKMGFPIEGIFLAKIFISCLCMIARLFFAQNQAEIKIGYFIRKSFAPIIIVLFTTQPFYYAFQHYSHNGTFTFYEFIFTLILECLIFLAIFFIGFTKSERTFVLNTIQKIFKINTRAK